MIVFVLSDWFEIGGFEVFFLFDNYIDDKVFGVKIRF